MRHTRDDLYQAWRAWTASLKSGGGTTIVVLTLATAVGATTAMFVLIKGLLGVLPYRDPDQLVMLWERSNPTGPRELRVSIPDYQDFVAQNRSFSHLGVYASDTHNLTVGENIEKVNGPSVGTGFFTLLGIRMLAGRDSTNDDYSVIVLSENLWRSRFPGWEDPIGKTVRVDGIDRKVIGIVPRGQEFPPTAAMWLPFVPTVENCACQRNGHSYQVVGRLKTGVSVTQADSEVKAIAARLASQYPDTNSNITAWLQPLRERLIGNVKPAMWMLVNATAALLLMACVSVATILFARGIHRGPEIAMRQVLGATRKRIVMQLFLESSFSAIIASGFGILVALLVLRLFRGIVPGSLPQVQNISIGPQAIGFAVLVSLLTVLIFSLLPSLQATRTSLLLPVRSGAVVGHLTHSRRIRNALIIIENTITCTLLAVSILLVNSLIRLTNVYPGFQQQGIISAELSLPSSHYSSPPQAASFYKNLVEHLSSLPQVESVAVVDSLPMTGSTEGTVYLPIGTPRSRPGQEPIARVSFVSPGYFKTMSIPLIRGRDFNAADGQQSHVVVISEGIARTNWPNDDAVGKYIGIKGAGSLSWEIIGLVPDIKDDGLGAASPPRLYLNEQEFGEKGMTIVVRTNGESGGLLNSLRHEVSALDPTLPIYNIRSMQDLVNESLARNRTVTRILSAFSIMSLILAAAGVYGMVLSNLVRRTREFGIRIAIGSNLNNIAYLVFREGFLLVGIGIVAGLISACVISRSLSSLLFGVGSMDIPSYLAAVGAQLLVVAIGCAALLRRITTFDPVIALRNG